MLSLYQEHAYELMMGSERNPGEELGRWQSATSEAARKVVEVLPYRKVLLTASSSSHDIQN